MRARRTDPRQEDFVILHDESLRRGLLLLQCASRKIINPVARMAVEVVVVRFLRQLVKRPEGGMVDLFEPSRLHEKL
jgi:hypothetical protein